LALAGPYEALFYDVLGCTSPRKIRETLQRDRPEVYEDYFVLLYTAFVGVKRRDARR